MQAVARLCPECLTTDASFPLIPDCASCKAIVCKEEFDFWNSPLYWETTFDEEGFKIQLPISAQAFLRQVVQPWTSFFQLITLS